MGDGDGRKPGKPCQRSVSMCSTFGRDGSKYPRRSLQMINEDFVEDGPKKMLTMRDQDQIVQELKKENFDLKLRLYMQTKQGESNEGKVSEYEQQLGAILNRFEEQQKVFEQQSRELAEAKQKEKLLMKRQRNLESECKLRDEKIQNLNISLSTLSTSMTNVSSPRHYTPARTTHSMYFPDSEEEEEEEEVQDGYTPQSVGQQQVSRVAPMRRQNDTSLTYHDEMRLVEHERPARNSFESTSSDPTHRITKNYYSTTINNPSQTRNNDGFDNIGIVKPNNSRTVIDVKIPEHSSEPQLQQQQQLQQKKKKKKGLLNVFKLCSGKSGQRPVREESIYHKRPTLPARVTTTQHNRGYTTTTTNNNNEES